MRKLVQLVHHQLVFYRLLDQLIKKKANKVQKLPKNKFHLIFSMVMGVIMVFLMTCVITLVNIGMPDDFLKHWLHAFLVALPIAVPVIYFVAPLARKMTARFAELP